MEVVPSQASSSPSTFANVKSGAVSRFNSAGSRGHGSMTKSLPKNQFPMDWPRGPRKSSNLLQVREDNRNPLYQREGPQQQQQQQQKLPVKQLPPAPHHHHRRDCEQQQPSGSATQQNLPPQQTQLEKLTTLCNKETTMPLDQGSVKNKKAFWEKFTKSVKPARTPLARQDSANGLRFFSMQLQAQPSQSQPPQPVTPKQLELRMRSSEETIVTSTTSYTSGDETVGLNSPPLSPTASRVPASPSSSTLMPHDDDEDDHDYHEDGLYPNLGEPIKDVDVDKYCNELLARYDHAEDNAKAALSALVSGKTRPHEGGNENAESNHEEDPTNVLLKILEDCEARWTSSSSKPVRESTLALIGPAAKLEEPTKERRLVTVFENSLVPILSRTSSDGSSGSTSSLSSASAGRTANAIIKRQQAEIAYLRAQLWKHQQLLTHEQVAQLQVSPQPPLLLEQIDTIPVEEIEVAAHTGDNISLSSGLTFMLPGNDDASAIPGQLLPPLRRPDAASVADNEVAAQAQTYRVANIPLQLTAADGTVRKAVYTGPCKNGKCTGMGVLRFVETGDMYRGEVLDGKMHGHGTYHFAKQRKNHKFLRGLFENNVYMGWNPGAIKRKTGQVG